MRRWTFGIACGLIVCVNAGARAQTTGTTPTTPTTTTAQRGAASIGTGAGIGTSDTNGGSFSGGQGGQGTAGGAGFSGGAALTGGQGGMQGGGQFGGRGGTATATVPTTNNPFRANYKTYMAAPAGAAAKAFGQPIYATVTTSQAAGQAGGFGRGGAVGGFGGQGASGLQGMGAQSTGFSTVGVRRAPSYSTSLGRGLPIVTPPPMTLLSEIRSTIAITDALPSKHGVQITMEGNAVVLRGRVEDERERRVLEGVVRLTPGVREIRNELTVPQQTANAGR